jgi:two-component system, cell cycle response regulator DivK
MAKRRVPEPPLVMIVDDYEPARDLYATLFRSAGYRVEEAANGEEAIEKGVRLQPSLFLMDLLLPGMAGWDVIRRLKAEKRTRNRPIVVITGAPRDDRARGAHEAGCDAYLVKPVLPDALLRVVRDLLNRTTVG